MARHAPSAGEETRPRPYTEGVPLQYLDTRITMKKVSKTFFATVGALLGIALLGACSGGAEVKAEEDANFVGDWALVEVEGDQEFADNMALFEEFGATILLKIDEDGACALAMEGVEGFMSEDEAIQPCTWDGKDKDKIVLDFGEGEKSEAVLKDGRLTLESDGDKIYFERVLEVESQS